MVRVGVSFSPCGSLIGDLQTVQVGLRPAAASLLQLVAVAGQEGACCVAVRGMPLFVMLRVPLVGYVVGVFKATVLVSDCNKRGSFRESTWMQEKPDQTL